MNMKKYIWMSVAALALASCSQNDELAQSGERLATTHVVFTANVESGMKTRAVTDPTDAAPTRALLEIYDASGTRVGNQIPGELNSEGTAFTFRADLDGLQTYTCAFWADTNEGTYNTESLKSISYVDATDEQQGIAFTAKCDINPSESKNVTVMLTHAVAKLVLHETGTGLKANDVVGVTFTRPNYTFDASSQTYTEDATTTGTAIDLSYTVTEDGKTEDLTAAYMLVPSSVVVNDVNLYFATPEHSKTITNVPLKTNHRTLLRGAFENLATPAPSQTFNITCDTNWEDDSEKAFTTIVNSETHTIVLPETGNLTTTLIEKAVADGTDITLTISGPMNEIDAQALHDYFYGDYTAKDTHVSTLDMSSVTGLTTIEDDTFYNATYLKKVTLPASFTSIGNWAFSGSGLEILTADNVTNVGEGVFGYCQNLTELSLPSVTTFGNGQFILSGCTSLTTLKLTSPDFDGVFGSDFFRDTPTANVDLYIHKNLKSNKVTVISSEGSTSYQYHSGYSYFDFKSITLVDDSGNPVDESTL